MTDQRTAVAGATKDCPGRHDPRDGPCLLCYDGKVNTGRVKKGVV